MRLTNFLSNLFQYPENSPWIVELTEKIKTAETEEERERYRDELNKRTMDYYTWW